MANLKVFISSTCYDLHSIRAQLRGVISDVGYEPVMSDQADVIYDPRIHTHSSCLREVSNCDVLVLVVGSRFGGTTVPKAMELIDLDGVVDLSRSDRFGLDKTKISITQAEVLQAIQVGIPVFSFVDAGVMRDHLTYEKNKNKSIISQIEFSSIDKIETAPYIFEFINFLRLRNENNSIFEFSRFEDIEGQLKKQWSGLFQRLLNEQRSNASEGRRIDFLSGQIADLKAAVLGSISSGELKETAKGAIRFRHMVDFVFGLAEAYKPSEALTILNSDLSWDALLERLGITEFKSPSPRDRVSSSTTILLREDGTHYRVRQPLQLLLKTGQEWEDFKKLKPDAKEAIINAILDSGEGRMPLVRHISEPYVEDGLDDLAGSRNALEFKLSSTVLRERVIEEELRAYFSSDEDMKDVLISVDISKGLVQIKAKNQISGATTAFRFADEYEGSDASLIARAKTLIKKNKSRFMPMRGQEGDS